MRKIIVAFDGLNFSETALQYAIYLSEKQPSVLVGVFLNELYYLPQPGLMFPDVPIWAKEDEEFTAEHQKIEQQFASICEQAGVSFRIHNDLQDNVLQSLIEETRFADLLIISSERFYINFFEDILNDALKTTLERAECPVLVVPETMTPFDNIVLTYQNHPSSVYAIKQFSYVMPALTNLPAHLVNVTNSNSDTNLPEQDRLTEWAVKHFSNLNINQLHGKNIEKTLVEWVASITNPIIVMGSFSRSMISQLFKESLASNIISQHKIPVFIAHK